MTCQTSNCSNTTSTSMEELTVCDDHISIIPATVKHLIVESCGEADLIEYQFYHGLKESRIEQLTITMQPDEPERGVDWSGLSEILSNIPPTVTTFSLNCSTKFLGEKMDLSWVPGTFEYFEFNLVEHVKKWAGYTYYSSVRCAVTAIPKTEYFSSDNPMECSV